MTNEYSSQFISQRGKENSLAQPSKTLSINPPQSSREPDRHDIVDHIYNEASSRNHQVSSSRITSNADINVTIND